MSSLAAKRTDLIEAPLTPTLAWRLEASMSPEDAAECYAFGVSPRSALWAGMAPGTLSKAWAALSPWRGGHVPVGAIGYSGDRIWSLWARLTVPESMSLLRLTPTYVRKCLAMSGMKTLGNYVMISNERAMGWMEASKCFTINKVPVDFGDRTFYSFSTKPYAELVLLGPTSTPTAELPQ